MLVLQNLNNWIIVIVMVQGRRNLWGRGGGTTPTLFSQTMLILSGDVQGLLSVSEDRTL